MLLWGIGLGTQESVMRAVVARMAPPDRRGTAYGVLNAVFGLVWFGGSAMLGILYDQSVAAVALVPLLLQLAAVPLALLLATLKWTQPR